MKTRTFRQTALLVMLLAIPAIASAEDAASEPTLADAGVFTAGEITVTGQRELTSQTVTAEEMAALDRQNLASVVNILPGVNLGNAGSRNEGLIYVRGFDIRQVPIYLDGVPLYVPYDGYIDPNRFTTFDLSGVTVSKGYTSVLYGPNTLGGAINMVSKKPEKSFEATMQGGMTYGDDQIASTFGSINAGSNLGNWYVQAGISNIDRNFVPMSDEFVPTATEDGGRRDNSGTEDFKGSIKVGYTPNDTDEYAVSFSGQHSVKGVPVYTGNQSITPRYWRYTDWDKASLYYIGKTAVGVKSYLKTRAFYDGYYNVLKSYDDATYTAQTKKYAFTSIYDDKTFGGSVEFGTDIGGGNTLKVAVHDKYDMHRSYNVGDPATEMADNTFSLATENSWKAAGNLTVVAGVRQDFRTTLKAEDSEHNNASFELDDNQATNCQLALVGKIDERQKLTAYVSRSTRFPTLKDRYSYKLGTAEPNPDLDPEQSWNYGLDYVLTPSVGLQLSASIYQSRLSDVIQQVNITSDVSQYQNTGKATFTGFECAADWQAADWLKAYTGYSYIDRQNDSNPDLYFTDVPRHKLNGYLRFTVARDAWAMVEGEYNTKRYSTSDGLYTASPYGLLNLRVHAPLVSSLSMQASVENLFDRMYEVSEGYPEPGRTFVMSLSYSL
ncbi:TonB-dependent receptor [Chlorobium sp. N1]|uniref:TonB-dependent receptor plug domain-containing protein n=1 Tax=Chlorobium sp. N1 TaxID=2491138 RepID=UPI00103E62AE|nr:TonB-dependent receptor [Chlorobium sp. N1]TCD47209.1 TonB-dependent receptor [Chlorobium sp. N1]